MVKFEGTLTGEAKKFYIKKYFKWFTIFFLYGMIGSLPIAFFISYPFFEYELIKSIYPAMILLYIIMCIFGPRLLKKELNKKIYIDNDTANCDYKNKEIIKKSVNDIKEIRDYGSFYYISFNTKKILFEYVCQKDLIVSGTIEEFEEQFRDKIVRKN